MKKIIYLILALSVITFSSCKKDDSDDSNNPSKENKFNFGDREFTIKTVYITNYNGVDDDGDYDIQLCVSDGSYEQATHLDYIGLYAITTNNDYLPSGTYVYSDDSGVIPRFDEAWFWDTYYGDDPDAIGGRLEVNRIDANTYEISFQLSWASEEDTYGYYKGEVTYRDYP